MTHLSEAILHHTNGITLTLQDASIAALLRDYADFFVLDAASRPFSAHAIENIIHAAGDTPVLVRVENTLPSTLQNYLNLGVDGLILTGINYAAEAEKAIAACLYPPEGIRHYRAPSAAKQVSLQALNDQITLIVEITTQQAAAQIDEICEVTGINGVLVSPTRLSVAMEYGFEAQNDFVWACLSQIYTTSQGYDLPFGLEGEDTLIGAPDFTLTLRDIDLLMNGVEQSVKNGNLRIPALVSTLQDNEKMMPEQEDDDFGVSLVATR